ncbi:MAG: hypothetical protein ACK4UJ_08310 [Leptonema sp. (in: bacteria)]
MKPFTFFLFFLNFSLFGDSLVEIKEKLDVIPLLDENLEGKVVHHNFLLKNQSYPSHILFYLDCEGDHDLLTDRTGHYSFLKKEIDLYEYSTQNQEYLSNKKDQACFFSNRNNQILIETKNGQWPYSISFEQNQSFDFSLSFWFLPLTLNLKEQNLFLWNSFSQENQKQFKIYIEQGNLKLKIKNIIFAESQPILLDLILLERKELEKTSWKHFFLSFSTSKKQIKFFLNNTIQKIITLPKKIDINFYDWSYPPFLIGKNFIGFLDEFYILNKFYDTPITFYHFSPIYLNPKSGRTNGTPKIFYTPIISLPKDTQMLNIFLDYEIPKGTVLKFEYTTYENLNQQRKNWTNILLQKKGFTNFFLERFVNLESYIQFRITMLQDSEGLRSPVIKKFQLERVPFSPLKPPSNLKVIPELSNENQICLEWEKSTDEEVESLGGYKIHVGIKEKEFDFVMDHFFINQDWKIINKKNSEFPLTDKEKESYKNRKSFWDQYIRNHIRIIITKEDLMNYYETFIKDSNFSRNRISLYWENDRIYYFAISNYKYKDSVKSDISNVVSYSF